VVVVVEVVEEATVVEAVVVGAVEEATVDILLWTRQASNSNYLIWACTQEQVRGSKAAASYRCIPANFCDSSKCGLSLDCRKEPKRNELQRRRQQRPVKLVCHHPL